MAGDVIVLVGDGDRAFTTRRHPWLREQRSRADEVGDRRNQ
jgi:hypothetical protein